MHLATRSTGWVSALICLGALAAASACGRGDDDSSNGAMNNGLAQNGSGGSSAASGSGGSSTTPSNPTTGGSGGTSAMHGSHDAGGTGSGGSHAGSGGTDSGVAARDAGTCFSPTQNLDTAYEAGAVGCACKVGDPSQCIQGVALICNGTNWDAAEDGPCDPGIVSMRLSYSSLECEAAGGVVVSDPGDGRLFRDGCPDGAPALGVIDNTKEPSSGFPVEGALCCQCATQAGCKQLVACGARAGATCKDTEFCAYTPSYYCGAADAESVCRPRPSQCTGLDQVVCGCDGKTYVNACAANAAGTGVNTLAACPSLP